MIAASSVGKLRFGAVDHPDTALNDAVLARLKLPAGALRENAARLRAHYLHRQAQRPRLLPP